MHGIQPCALLLLVGSDWQVEAISANAAMLGGQRPADALGQPLADLIGSKEIHTLRNRMSWLSKDESEVHDFGVQWGEVALDIRASREGDGHLIEAELAVEPRLPDGIGMVRSMTDRLLGNDPLDLADHAMRQLCALTGFDSLSLLDRNGQSIASVCRGQVKPSGEMEFPIAMPRVVADRDAEPVPILGDVASPPMGRVSYRALGHDEQRELASRDIAATMTFPLSIDGAPVGAVHAMHPSPRRCGAERRSVAHLFAERVAARMARNGWKP